MIAAKTANPGAIAIKIDYVLRAICWRGRPLLDPEKLRPWRRAEGTKKRAALSGTKAPRCSVKRLGLTLAGAVVYGVLFLPFSLGVLQQTMERKQPLDPYGDEGLTASSWLASSAFWCSVLLLCVVPLNFASEELVGAGTVGLGVFLGAVVVLIWLQQALTWYYIVQRPELAVVEKHRKKKFPLCGKVYSTMNPRNLVNYFQISLVLFEFLQFAAVLFHPLVPWVEESGEEERWLTAWLRRVLPEFLVNDDTRNDIVLGALLVFVTFYILLLGELIYSERDPHGIVGSLCCDICAGSLYVGVVARLLGAADTADLRSERTAAVLGLLAYMTTAIFVASLRGESGVASGVELRFSCRWLALERILKGTLGVAVVVCPRLPAYVEDERRADLIRAATLIGWAMWINGLHLVFLWRWKTCSVSWVTQGRKTLLFLIAFGQVMAMCAITVGGPAWFLALIVGVSLATAAMVGYVVYKTNFAPIKDGESNEVRAARLRRAQDKLYKHGAGRTRGRPVTIGTRGRGPSRAAKPSNSDGARASSFSCERP